MAEHPYYKGEAEMTFPLQKEIELPLLQEIEAMGGEAKPKDLYPRVTAHFPQLTEADLKEKLPTGGNKWTNWIQWARQHLVERGEIDKSTPGIWRITQKGRERLKGEGVIPPPPLPPEGVDKLAEEIKGLVEKLVEMTKKKETPLPSHNELVQKVKEMGKMLGKATEPILGVPYQHDCVWKENPYASPILVVEVCDKGILDKDITSLDFAVATWGAKGILVIFDESDFHKAQEKLAHKSYIYPIKADDMLKLHSLLQAGNIPAIRAIFGI